MWFWPIGVTSVVTNLVVDLWRQTDGRIDRIVITILATFAAGVLIVTSVLLAQEMWKKVRGD